MTTLIDQAIIHHQAGRLKEAIGLYEQALAELSASNAPPNAALLHFIGMAYYGLGRFGKAVKYLEQASRLDPGRPDYHFGYGNALNALKRYKLAQRVFGIAMVLDPGNAAIAFNYGNVAQALKDFESAIVAYRQALAADPGMTQALANLAVVLTDNNRFGDYAKLLRDVYAQERWASNFIDVALMGIPHAANKKAEEVLQALEDLFAAHPENGALPWLIAHYHFMDKNFAVALPFYEQARDLTPQNKGAVRALGFLYFMDGKREAALTCFKDCVADDPEAVQVLKLANVFITLAGRTRESIAAFEVLEEAYPDNIKVLYAHFGWLIADDDIYSMAVVSGKILSLEENEENLINHAAALVNVKRNLEALEILKRVLKINPKSYPAIFNMGTVYVELENLPKAIEMFTKALKLKPADTGAAVQLSAITGRLGLIDKSIRILEKALKLSPESATLWAMLGNNKLRRGDNKGALACYEKARAGIKRPEDGTEYGMQLMTANYIPDIPPEIVADMHFKWGEAMMALQAKNACVPPVVSEMKSKLKIGYVSGDFRGHSCSYFSFPLIEQHDPARVDVFCYMTEHGRDEATIRFRQIVPNWREIDSLSDTDATTLIMEDGIDILVDLSGHTLGNRLSLFARKPAPIAVTWLGYPNTTGLPAIDYRFTDALADPPDLTEKYHSETLYRLPHFLCYKPSPHTPPVSPLGAYERGYITFGCFNNSNKIADPVVDTWVEILKQTGNSRLVLKTNNLSDAPTLEAFRKKFTKRGIAEDRIEWFQSFPNKSDHLMTYSEIDLALDPFPYNGTTTTFEALWMGVPMITLEGQIHAARVGKAILDSIGTPELVASTIEDYIATAVALAKDTARINDYRTRLRGMLQNSPLMDAKSFAVSVENAYFDMWERAVQKNKKEQGHG
jgi:predicted O-linked N-acetylglucosamine transferase (SPINDLY family)